MNPRKVFVKSEASRGRWRDKGELKCKAVPPDYTAGEEREEAASISVIETVLWLSAHLPSTSQSSKINPLAFTTSVLLLWGWGNGSLLLAGLKSPFGEALTIYQVKQGKHQNE